MSRPRRSETPLSAFGHGVAAGLAATLVLSVLSRATFPTRRRRTRSRHPSGIITPGEALTRASQAGPEGSAGKFALKVGAGLFGRDLTPHAHLAGEAVHFAYGSFWGGMFGLIYASLRDATYRTAAALGAGLWALGPATLVPAMKLMPPLARYPLHRSALLLAGHVVYGGATLAVFRKLHGR